MQTPTAYRTLRQRFRECYGREPALVAYAPGRVEVLGNHTDYNEGFVLSAALPLGTFFALAPAQGPASRLTAGDLMETVSCDPRDPRPAPGGHWSNYSLGVLAQMIARQLLPQNPNAFDALFFGNIPLGSGLSSSAALELATVLGLAHFYDLALDKLTMARIAQQAEHDFAGVHCGLMDQITSLFGSEDHLVMTDFRSLEVQSVPFAADAALVLCQTHVKHALVDGVYNERRADCEEAAARFAEWLPHPVGALRDVSTAEWRQHKDRLPERVAKRAAHPIGENERVLQGVKRLRDHDTAGFGRLMFASHQSSRQWFENSSPELDYLVDTAQTLPDVMGGRLSGGGFGGSVVLLSTRRQAETVGATLATAYRKRFGTPCDLLVVRPGKGAGMVQP